MAKPAFDPSAPFEAVDDEVAAKPPFDPKQPFEAVDDGAPQAAKPPFDPNAPHEVVPLPRERPQAAQASPPLESRIPAVAGKVPLPQARPLRADVAPSEEMPPVVPLEDVPFRAKMRGQEDRYLRPQGDLEPLGSREAAGTSGMLTGTEAYEQQFGRPAREAFGDIPAQTAIKGSIDVAKDAVTEAQTAYDAALERQRSMHEAMPRRGTTGQQRRLNIDDEVDRAAQRLTDAKAALGTEQRRGIETETPRRVFGAKAAEAVGTMVPTIVGGAARPFDELLDKAGLPRGTGVADYMQEATKRIANANLTDPQQQESLSAKYGSGVGSMAGFAVTGAIGKAAGLPAWATSAGAGALQNAEDFYREADALGATAMQKALAYIAGGVVGSTEGLGSGRVLDQLDKVSGGGVKRYLGAVLKSGTEEGFQEGLQQLLENMSKFGILGKDPGDITHEVASNALIGAVLGMGMAGVAHAPTLVGGRSRITEGGVPIPNQEVVTPEQIAAQVAAGNIPVHDPGGPTQPLPTGVPVTSVEGGVKTTTTLHGPAGAYEVGADATGKPTLKPTMSQGEWIDMVNDHATTLYPDVTNAAGDPVISPQAMAFENGAHGYPVHQGLPLDTPIDTVMSAYAEGQQFAQSGPTAGGEAAAARESEPVTGMYSRLRAWVTEKGPSKLPANEWLAKLTNNNNFSGEEVRDLQLAAWLGGLQQGSNRPVQVTKDELLGQIDAMTAPLVEVTRTPFTPQEKEAQITALESQIREVMAADRAARSNTGGPNWEHPTIDALANQLINIGQNTEWAQYEKYTTPGPRLAYTELTMHLPGRGTLPPAIRTLRTVGGDVYGTHYETPNEIVTIRLTVRETADGQKVAIFEEGQSDVLQAVKKGFELPSDMPYKEGWPALGFTRFLMWAAQQGITRVAWANSEEQMRRYPHGTDEEIARRKAGMEHFYDRVIPSIAKRWARNLGGTLGTTMIPDTTYVVRPTEQFFDPATQTVVQDYGVFAPDFNRPLVTGNDLAYLNEYAQSNTTHSLLPSMVLPQSAIDTINQKGVPSYSRFAEESAVMAEGAEMSSKPSSATQLQKAAIEPLKDALNSLIKKLKLGIDVKVVLHNNVIRVQVPDPLRPGQMKWERRPKTLGIARYLGMSAANRPETLTHAEIHISVAQHKNAAQVWATMAHEVGHIIMVTTFHRASAAIKTAVLDAWDAYRTRVTQPGATMEDLIRAQSNFVFLQGRIGNKLNTLAIDKLTPDQHDYWTGFPEFFAEQVAKWATSSAPPLAHVEKFFAGLARTIINFLREASKVFGMNYEAVPELTAFLDGFLKSEVAAEMGPQAAVTTAQETTVKNGTQMSPEDAPVPAQPEVLGAAGGINGAFEGRPPKEAQEAKAYADKFSWLRKMFYGIHQLAIANPHIQTLQDYVETVSIAKLTKDAIMIQAQEVLKKWNSLGGKQADAVSLLLDDVQNMAYLSPDEVKRKAARHPTLAELQVMAKKYGVTQAGLAVYAEIGKSFSDFLKRVEAVLRSEANKIADETRRDLQHAKIDKQMAAYRSKPYFPAMRFGSYTITIRNAAKQVIHFETFETQRQRDRALRAINGSLQGTDDVAQAGFLNKEVRPLLGVPTAILELMGEKMKLSAAQRDALDQLKFELSPAQSFKHRFQHKKRIAGYSTDFQRVYANYFWHGANHLMKTMYADRLRGLTKMTKEEVADAPDITKREKIQAFMTDHTDNWLDPKPDWAAIRSMAFLWQLAFSPAAAAQNLTQTMLTSHPFLASKFGDLQSIAALGRAGREFQTFYTKGKLEGQANFVQQALFQGMEDGIIKETQAPELAGYADGNVLSRGWGGNQLQRYMTKFNEIGAFMFEMAEQVNRRLVFRAALQLALKNPNAKYVRDTVAKRNLLYQKVRGNMTEAQAAAYVTAYDATVTTQFQYGKEFAPRVLRGRARAVLVFKTFQQSYVTFLLQNKGAALRSLIIIAALGGLMGVPGADDAKEILRALGYQLFGKDFKLEREIRRWIIELLGKDGNGADIADLILHGASRKGYGIPAALNMIAGTAGIDFTMPTFDRSKAISSGTILPLELGKIFGPPLSPAEKVISEQGAKASGAIFGVGFAMYNAMRDQQLNWSDSKRWERVMPRAIANVTKAYRAYTDEGARTRTGSQIVKYDPRDALGMAEIIGLGMGYVPYRQNLEWDKVMSRQDAVKMWDIRREGLMRQFGNAVLGKDSEEKSRVIQGIREFNKTLPPEARGKAITSETLQKSVEGRAEKRVMQEKGLSTKKSDIPIIRAEDKLYPESQRTTRPVPRGLTP